MAATLLWALVAVAPRLLWRALAARGAAGAGRLVVDGPPTPAEYSQWLAKGLQYHASLSLSPNAKAYLEGNAPPASEWPNAEDWESTFVSAMRKLPPNVSTDDHDGTPIGEGQSIGLLAAKMKMDRDQLQLLPEAFRTGLFSPCDAECPTWPVALRFSHTAAAGEQLMRAALKIGGVGGGEVDLTFTETLKSFPIADREELKEFVYMMRGGKAMALLAHPVEMGELAAHAVQAKKYAKAITRYGVLGKDYHSLTPYLIGDHGSTPGAMKFRMVPVGKRALYPSVTAPPGGSEKAAVIDAMRKQLVDTMTTDGVSFDFEIQVATDPKDHPIDNANAEWNDDTAPWVRMGTVEVPRQEFEEPATVENVVGGGLWQRGQRAAFNSKELVFLPGRSPHTPLGDINAFRASLYPVYDQARQEHLLGKAGGVAAACPFADISAWLRRK